MDNNSLPKANLFGGFKKKEVLSYIFELNESAQDAQQKLQEQIDELTKSRDELAAALKEKEIQFFEAQGKHDELKRELENAVKAGEAARESAEKLKEQLQKRDREIAEKDDSIARYATINAELAEKNRQFEEKSAKVEAAAAQIGGMFVQAREDAERVASEAKSEADKIIADAQSHAERLTSEAQARAGVIIAEAKDSAEAYIDDANESLRGIYGRFSDFCSDMSELQKTVLDAADNIRGKIDEIGEAVAGVQNITPEIPHGTPADPAAPSPEEESGRSREHAAEPEQHSAPVDISLANDLLGEYGIHKDEYGFFRLADK